MNIIKRCRYGLMIFNRKDIWQGRSLETYCEYSEAEVDLFKKVVKSGDLVIEIGANIGSLSLPLARLAAPGMLLCFEPERNCFYTLCGNMAINNIRNVFCFQQVLSDECGSINVPELDHDRMVNWGGLEMDKDYSKVSHYPVAMNTVDALGVGKISLIKIDVEGMEEKVLRGAVKSIEKSRPFLIVENDRIEKSADLIKFIDSLGYKMYSHYAPFFNTNNFASEPQNVFGNTISLNLFCHPKEVELTFNPSDLGLLPVLQIPGQMEVTNPPEILAETAA